MESVKVVFGLVAKYQHPQPILRVFTINNMTFSALLLLQL